MVVNPPRSTWVYEGSAVMVMLPREAEGPLSPTGSSHFKVWSSGLGVASSSQCGSKGEKRLCTECREREREVIFHPCAHMCVCRKCSKDLSSCPMCHADILHSEIKRRSLSRYSSEAKISTGEVASRGMQQDQHPAGSQHDTTRRDATGAAVGKEVL